MDTCRARARESRGGMGRKIHGHGHGLLRHTTAVGVVEVDKSADRVFESTCENRGVPIIGVFEDRSYRVGQRTCHPGG